MMVPMTESEHKVYDAVVSIWREKARPPTYLEIRNKSGFRGAGNVYRMVSNLVDRGRLQRHMGRVFLTERGLDELGKCPCCGRAMMSPQRTEEDDEI